MGAERAREGRLWAEQWAVDASVKADSIESRLLQALAVKPGDARAVATARAVRRLVDRGREATLSTRRRRTIEDCWRGTSVVRAYQSLHAAEVLLVDVLPEPELDALALTVTPRACELLDAEDPRRAVLRSLHELGAPTRRAHLRSALALIYEAADQAYVRVRDFRNLVYVSSALIAVLLLLLGLVVGWHPVALPLCFPPQGSGAPDPAGAQTCPSGLSDPSGADVWIVGGLGLLGGSLAAALSILHLRTWTLPYDIPVALALLKVPAGGLTAIAGILLLSGGFVPGLSGLETQRQILAYALVLGYAQQVATRLIDERAQRIVDGVLRQVRSFAVGDDPPHRLPPHRLPPPHATEPTQPRAAVGDTVTSSWSEHSPFWAT